MPRQQHVVEVDIGKMVVIHAARGDLFHWHAGLAGCSGSSHLRLLVLGLANAAVPSEMIRKIRNAQKSCSEEVVRIWMRGCGC